MSSERGFLWVRYITKRKLGCFLGERIKMQRSVTKGTMYTVPFNMKVDIIQVVIKTLYANLYIVHSAMLFISERGQYRDKFLSPHYLVKIHLQKLLENTDPSGIWDI